MTSPLHQIPLIVALSILVPSLPAQKQAEENNDGDWAAILEEAEATADWASDPLADLGLLDEPSSILLIASVKAGAGYSSNFLKRPEAVSSRFYHFEADAWLNWFLEKSTVSILFFGESNIYQNKVEVDDEYLTFLQAGWTMPMESFELGVEGIALFADQIYDASLSPGSSPSGTRIRQARPEASVHLDWFPGKQDRLRISGSARRTRYNIENQDYWEPVLGFEWERLWRRSLTTQLRAEGSRQYFDDEVGRDANGITLPEGDPLLVDRLLLEQRLTWKPQEWEWLELSASAGISWDEDQSGVYETMRQTWASIRTKLSGGWGELRLTGRWMELSYADRQVGFFDPTPVRYTRPSLRAEYKLPLPGSIDIYLRGEWTDLDSRIDEDSYSEQRGEILFQWSY
jgi:hypothetical protein